MEAVREDMVYFEIQIYKEHKVMCPTGRLHPSSIEGAILVVDGTRSLTLQGKVVSQH